MPVFFITDILVYLLLTMILLFVFYTRRYTHLSAPWRTVMRNKLAMASAVILLFYTCIGLLDSVHFYPQLTHITDKETYATEVHSLLDQIIKPLKERTEKSYSAPLAQYAYTRELVNLAGQGQVLVYPRLSYGGAHLNDPANEFGFDVLIKVLRGLYYGVLISITVAALFVFVCARGNIARSRHIIANIRRQYYAVPWHVILATATILIVFIAVLTSLASQYHILGTDKVGQDVLYQALKSIRTGLVIGTLTTLITIPFAITLGLMAGYFGGWIDDTIQYFYTVLNSIPGVLLIAASMLILQAHLASHAGATISLAERADLRLLFLCIILGITNWTGLCRLLRGEALKLREIEYVRAAEALGASKTAVLFRHLLPNVMHLVIVSIVIDFSGLVLAEAVLSYISIGVDPSMHSWGNMINSARLEMAREPVVWWPLAAAFIFMFILVLALNLFADAVRDAFDPRSRGNLN